MKFNLTDNIIFKKEDISNDIRVAIKKANETLIEYYNTSKEEVNVSFTSMTLRYTPLSIIKNAIIFNKLSEDLLKQNFSNEFIIDIFELNQLSKMSFVEINLEKFHKKYKMSFRYSAQYAVGYSHGLYLVLMLLHFNKVIHLPFKFKLPFLHLENKDGKKKRVDIGYKIYPEMLSTIRNLDSSSEFDEDSKFLTVSNKEHIISYGAKLFLALGWIDFKDVDLKEIIDLKEHIEKEQVFNTKPPYQLIVTLLKNKHPNDFPIDSNMWLKESRGRVINNINKKKTKDVLNFTNILDTKNLTDLEEVYSNNIDLELFKLENLELLKKQMPEYEEAITYWELAEKSYLNRVKLESVKSITQCFKHLNLYLFFILPLWYKFNKSKIAYPKSPKDLKGNIFISRIIETKEILPITFTEFLNKRKEERDTTNEYQYVVLKSISKFFDFIVTYAEDLKGCSGFINSISDFDFPRVRKSMGTNKGLIPRHLFGYILSYIEMLQAYNAVVLEKIINKEITFADISEGYLTPYGSIINTIIIQDKVGFVPMLCWNNKMIIFKEIPNFLDFGVARLKDGQVLRLPHPHLLNHIYIALQTGLRGNHIQWLDAEKYNSMVKNDGNTFTHLYVNTDKSKTSAWTPIVHKKVLETLDAQLTWRNLIDNPNFNEKKFYNNNEKSKWGKFYTIFSYGDDGLPYNDSGYKNYWLILLTHLQNTLENFNIKPIVLTKLLPTGISFNDFNLDVKLKEYGDKCENVCELRWTSDITPHSARVSVVSNYITALPAEVIGKYITGQTEAVVHHYVKLDPNYLTEIENGQKDGLAKLAIQKEHDKLSGKEQSHPLFADKDNSNLAKSFSINKQETITQYGCISINIKEEGKTGIDLLLEESNAKIAFNKTEICPYNNNCPADLIKELKGLRRCGVCPYAVRSVDHLPAIAIKKRQFMEFLQEIEGKLTEATSKEGSYSMEELNSLQEERQRITEELLGWIVSEEILESNRKQMVRNESTTQYVVKKPEILIQKLQQITKKEGDVEYLLTRLNDCESFPNFDTPIIKAKFDMLRRKLLARLNDFKGAFDSKIPVDPAHECLGLLREVINRFGLTHEQTMKILSTNMLSLGDSEIKPLLELNYVK